MVESSLVASFRDSALGPPCAKGLPARYSQNSFTKPCAVLVDVRTARTWLCYLKRKSHQTQPEIAP